ncbi:MAG: AAA family ATPase [Paludibacteraceae bacterium]
MFKVGIIGPESTGKSSLGKYFAKRYGATYIPEYARDYVAALRRAYTYEDVCNIARKQIEQIKGVVSGQWSVVSGQGAGGSDQWAVGSEQGLADSGQLSVVSGQGVVVSDQLSVVSGQRADSDVIFFDTELIVTRVWFDYVYGAAPDWLLSAMQQYKMDAYLLTYPDIPWIPDPTRENGSDEMRLQLFRRYEQEIQALDVPYYIIRHTDNPECPQGSE